MREEKRRLFNWSSRMSEPIALVTAADIARVVELPLASVLLWLKRTERPPVARRNGELLYLPSAAQALLDEAGAEVRAE
jgi:hypothetical protein